GGSQEFSATYTKVEPSDAVLTIETDALTISVDPGFTSTNSNEYYKLEVLNSSGEVYGSYSGNLTVTINVIDCTGLDQIIFKYYECAIFQGEEYVYDTYETAGLDFEVPSVSLAETLGFDGTYFTIDYECSMIYDYSTSSMILNISDGANTYTKDVNTVASSGTITLDCITGEIGTVSITPELTFKDNTTSATSHTITMISKAYEMNYSFEVTSVKADLSDGGSTIPITMSFSYDLPSTYSISITDGNSLDITTEVCDEYYFDSLDSSTDSTLVIQVKDSSNNNWGDPVTFTISSSSANANYVTPTMNCVNPGDALVTYNDDGTINIYRKVNFSCSNENVYYNAFIYNSSTTDDETGREIFSNCYDSIGRDTYSIIENIPDMNYYFRYYMLFDYNNVTYVMYEEWPSGGIETITSTWTTVSTSDGQTTITVSNTNSYEIDNKIIIDGQEYQYTTYTSSSDTEFTLVLDGELTITSVTIYASYFDDNYDAYSEDIVLSGNKYKELTYTPTIISS
ncbi:MAG: hypothetical protein ACI35W_06350, partial [Anaeroplasmataceae bacterium]